MEMIGRIAGREKLFENLPGPRASPFKRPILKTTALSYSWTTLNKQQRENGSVIVTRRRDPIIATSSINLVARPTFPLA